MKNQFVYILVITLIAVGILYSCKKNDVITGKTAWDTYINKTGHNMTIVKYKNASVKNYAINDGDTLFILTPWDTGADTTNSMFYADSAKVTFNDGKTYLVKDTSKLKTNFLKRANFEQAISPTGQVYYFRYTFNDTDYKLAK